MLSLFHPFDPFKKYANTYLELVWQDFSPAPALAPPEKPCQMFSCVEAVFE
jgi:hypothetical protein